MLRHNVAKYWEAELKARDFEAATPRQIQKGGQKPETDENVYDLTSNSRCNLQSGRSDLEIETWQACSFSSLIE